jgi:hypothetical protein
LSNVADIRHAQPDRAGPLRSLSARIAKDAAKFNVGFR